MAEILKLKNILPAGADNVVVDSKYVKGGYIAVATIDERDSLKGENGQNIIAGSLCYCQEDSKFYQYNGTNWEERKFNSDKLDIYTSKSGYKQSLEFKINDIDNGVYYFIKAETYTNHSAPIDDSASFFNHLCGLQNRQLTVKPVYSAVIGTDEHITDYSEDFKCILAVDLVEDNSLKITLNNYLGFPASWL